ncbi:hypothetical protein EYR40_010903 [Pleurotus pulmonarius]|nr:hypothetical protein EYR40_010903 [Pleurotus pulmonarius]
MQFTAAFIVLAVAQSISAISLHPRQEGGCVAEVCQHVSLVFLCVATEFSGPVHCCPAVPDLIQPPYAPLLHVPETRLNFGLDASPSTPPARARPVRQNHSNSRAKLTSDFLTHRQPRHRMDTASPPASSAGSSTELPPSPLSHRSTPDSFTPVSYDSKVDSLNDHATYVTRPAGDSEIHLLIRESRHSTQAPRCPPD